MAERASVAVGGVTPFTTIDFPGRLSAVVFCQGCPLRCGYCHNPHLIPVAAQSPAGPRSWQDVLEWLATRVGLLDGVVFSGGEPLLQRRLPEAAAAVRELGFAVALHTAGIYPRQLAAVLPALDWVGFDVKAAFDDYTRITGADTGTNARAALVRLLESGRSHEVRCTVDPRALHADDIGRMARELAALGVRRMVLQACRGPGLPRSVPEDVVDAAAVHLALVELRGG